MSVFLAALLLGLLAGAQPGPLFLTMVRESVARGFRAGAGVAVAPWVTDGPIAVTVLTLLQALGVHSVFFRILSGVGALYLAREAFKMWVKPIAKLSDSTAQTSRTFLAGLWSAMKVNYLNPNPWMFWSCVAGPTMLRLGPLRGSAYGACILTGTTLAMLAVSGVVSRGRSTRFLAHPLFMRVLALCMGGFAIMFGVRTFS